MHAHRIAIAGHAPCLDPGGVPAFAAPANEGGPLDRPRRKRKASDTGGDGAPRDGDRQPDRGGQARPKSGRKGMVAEPAAPSPASRASRARKDPAPARTRTPPAQLGSLAADLTAAREAAGLSRAQAADAVGLTENAIRYIEVGQRRPLPTTLRALGEAYGMSESMMKMLSFKLVMG